MTSARIARVAVAHPPNRIDQGEAAQRISAGVASGRRAEAVARGTMIASRAAVLPAAEILALGSIERRNDVYREHVARLAARAGAGALCGREADAVGCVVTSSCTGYALPGLSAQLVDLLSLRSDIARVPITEAGCAGGVVALARAADFVRSAGRPAIAAASELCTLSFHDSDDDETLTANLLFGDGAGAARIEPGDGEGMRIVDSASMLVPCSAGALGFDLTDQGFRPVIDRGLADVLLEPTLAAVDRLLCANGLTRGDVAAWLIHPGGARILQRLQQGIGLERDALHWSWDSLRANGNTSSAAIYDVLERYMSDPAAPRGWGVCVAFGPGVAIELLLVHRP